MTGHRTVHSASPSSHPPFSLPPLFLFPPPSLPPQVLRDASSSGSRDWSPGDRELEQAELVVTLLYRLVPAWRELHPTHAEGLRHSLYRLAATFCCSDAKSSSPYVRGVGGLAGAEGGGAGGGGGVSRAVVVARSVRVSTLRASLVRRGGVGVRRARVRRGKKGKRGAW